MQLFFSIIGILLVMWILMLVFDNKYLNGRTLRSLKRLSSLDEDWSALRTACFENLRRIEDIEALNKYLEDRIDVLKEHFNQIASYEVEYIGSEDSDEPDKQ